MTVPANVEPLRVVIAEDEPMAAESLARELVALGCDVVAITTTGDAALAARITHRPHACLADVVMPAGDGLSLARAPRAAVPELRAVFITAHPQFAVDAFAEEVVDFVSKPLRRARLADAIARVRKSIDTGVEEPRILVGEHGALHVLPVREIEWVQADGASLWLHTLHQAWAPRERMQRLEEQLVPLGPSSLEADSAPRRQTVSCRSIVRE